MNISVALLTVIILHLTILVFSIKEYYKLVELIVPIHFLPILLCIITTLAYLFENELSLIQLNINNMAICLNIIPKYLLSLTLIIIIINIRKSWIIVFEFFDVISETEENKQK